MRPCWPPARSGQARCSPVATNPASLCFTSRARGGAAAAVQGVSVTRQGTSCLSASTDCSVRLWPIPGGPSTPDAAAPGAQSTAVYQGKNAFLGVDCHWSRDTFATSGAQVCSLPSPPAASATEQALVSSLSFVLTCCMPHPSCLRPEVASDRLRRRSTSGTWGGLSRSPPSSGAWTRCRLCNSTLWSQTCWPAQPATAP